MTAAHELDELGDPQAFRRAQYAHRRRVKRREQSGRGYPRHADEISERLILGRRHGRPVLNPAVLARGFVADRPSRGSFTPAGADEGRSTSSRELAERLDELADEAAAHEWWLAHRDALDGL